METRLRATTMLVTTVLGGQDVFWTLPPLPPKEPTSFGVPVVAFACTAAQSSVM
jgi:hypothetical protein